MARETIPSECVSGTWKWEKENTVFMIVHDFSAWYQFRCTFLPTASMQQNPSCGSLSYVKTFPIFSISVWLHDEFNLKWTDNQMFISQCLWCVITHFHVLQLKCLYLSVLLTNQDMDSNTLFTLILLWQILKIHSPFLPSFAAISLAKLVTPETPVCFIKYPMRIICV